MSCTFARSSTLRTRLGTEMTKTDTALVALLDVLEDVHAGMLVLPIGAVDDLHHALTTLAGLDVTS